MKKVLVFCLMLVLTSSVFVPTIAGNKKNTDIYPVEITINQVEDEIEIIYEINGFVEIPIKIDGVEYSILRIGEESNLLLAGKPDIPSICRSIVIPDNAKMEIDIVSTNYEEFDKVLIAPSKGNLPRSINPDDIPFEFGDVYNEDTWFPGKIASLREPYLLRDFRGQVVDIYPIQYNPIRKIVRFYNYIKVNVYPNGIDTINIINRDKLPDKVDSDFKLIYKTHFINFGKTGRYDPVEEQGNMLIITYDDFWDEMIPFLEWKLMKGIPTEMVKVSTIGNSNAIKTHIENYYNDYGLTFVLLVGDAAQVPTFYSGYYASDPTYSYIVGSDSYPDLFVGRFSAQNPGDLETQIERSIEYEKYPQTGADWYHKGAGIGSNGWRIGDDGEYDWEHIRNIRNKLFNYTYTEVDEFYDGSKGGDDAPGDPTPSMVATALNDGRSVTNYCGHGGPTGWSTSGFSNSDIYNLVNDNMLPYVICVACNNGQFDDYDECFCEAWLRATNNSEPTGAIAVTGSSKGMSWEPPMDAQDEMMDLLVESYTDNVKHTIGGIHYNGCMHMNDEYGYSGYSETDTWHVFGDPSLQIRTDTPVEMTVIRDDEIEEEATSFEVTVSDVEGALCALSRNGELLSYAYTDENGYALIELDEPVMGGEPLDLVITAYNKIPYIAELPVHTNDPPEIPEQPSGPTELKVGEIYSFTTRTTDPEGDHVYYMWRWGDGNYSLWIGPYNSEETANASHMWLDIGNYNVRVKAKDTFDQETDWSEPLQVSVTKSRALHNTIIPRLLKLFPNTFLIFRYLFKLIIY